MKASLDHLSHSRHLWQFSAVGLSDACVSKRGFCQHEKLVPYPCDRRESLCFHTVSFGKDLKIAQFPEVQLTPKKAAEQKFCFKFGFSVLLKSQKRTKPSFSGEGIHLMKVITLLLSSLLSTSAFAAECYLGEVRSFAFNYALQGFIKADGQELQINQHQALFSLLGGRYGGNSLTTFAVPNLNSPSEKLVHFICSEGIYPSRQ